MLISKCLFGVFKSTKKNTIFVRIFALASKKRPNKKNAFYSKDLTSILIKYQYTYQVSVLFRLNTDTDTSVFENHIGY